jgi:phosphoribosyl 1,2-cyclic phosphodiesterase
LKVLPPLFSRRQSGRRRDAAEEGQQPLFDFRLPVPAPAAPPEPAEELAPDPEPIPPPRPRLAGPPLRVGVLGSGSGGNAVVVESGSHRLLIDAGFSCRELVRRMKKLDFDPATLSGLLLTHEHGDHCRGVDRFARKFDLPIYATEGTLAGTSLRDDTARVTIRSGEPVEVAGFRIEPFLIPHDAREPVGLVVEDPLGRRVGLVADLGCRTSLAWGRLHDLDILLLETNHDLDMLRNGPYPWSLKQRVAGRHGHLSNREAAEGLPELVNDRLRWVVLYHLSRTNNLPGLAAAAIGEALDREGCPAELAVTEQDHPTPWLEVTA